MRARPGPLRVVVHPSHEGVLIDISMFGALVHLDAPQAVRDLITVDVEWERTKVQLQGRVVWSSADPEASRTVWAEGYSIAIEFEHLATAAALALRRIVSQRSAPDRCTDMPITTYNYKEYEDDVQLTPLEPSPYDPSRFEARVTRVVRLLEGGVREPLNELLFRIATGRDREEAILRIQAEVQSRLDPGRGGA